MEATGWRKGLSLKIVYKRRFAFRKTLCVGEIVWLKYYYSKYQVWSGGPNFESEYTHTDFVENITEADYIIEKLTSI